MPNKLGTMKIAKVMLIMTTIMKLRVVVLSVITFIAISLIVIISLPAPPKAGTFLGISWTLSFVGLILALLHHWQWSRRVAYCCIILLLLSILYAQVNCCWVDCYS